mgnify:CR=1 FL=1
MTIRVLAIQPALRVQQAMPNLHLIRQTVEKHVAAAPADLLVLPEVFNGVSADDDPLVGPLARQFLGTLARACNLAVVGSIDLKGDDGRIRNTALLVDRTGAERGTYVKRVLFGRERELCTPGDGPGIFDLDGLRVGILICGDLWRADLVAELRGRVDVLCVPAKTTVPDAGHTDYARRLWSNLALTRAMEAGLPVVVADWAEARHEAVSLVDGTRVKAVHYTSGATCITDPSRRPVFDAIQQRQSQGDPALLAATIDLDAVAAFRDYRRTIGLLPE